MCSIDWTLTANMIAAITGAGTLLIAWLALTAWQGQLRGASQHGAALEILTAARSLRYAFNAARSPLYMAWEFPEKSSWQKSAKQSADERADDYQHIYNNRLKTFWPFGRALMDLRAKGGAILGDEVVSAIEAVAKVAHRLHFYMEQHVDILREGEAVKDWTDQKLVAEVNAVMEGATADDEYSKKLDDAISKLTALLDPHLLRRERQRDAPKRAQ